MTINGKSNQKGVVRHLAAGFATTYRGNQFLISFFMNDSIGGKFINSIGICNISACVN